MVINNINKDFEVDKVYGSGSDIAVMLFCQNWEVAAKKKNGYVHVERH